MVERYSSAKNREKTFKIKVSKIKADNVPVVGWRAGRFLVDVKVNDSTAKSDIATADSGSVSWDEEFHFDASDTSIITLTLLATHRVRAVTIVGWSEEGVTGSLWSSTSNERRLRNDTGTLRTNIHFNMELLPQDEPCADKRQAASNARARSAAHDLMTAMGITMGSGLGPAHPPGAETHARYAPGVDEMHTSILPAAKILGLEPIDSVSEIWDHLIEHVELFTKVVNRFSEIHPYAKFACSILTMAQKVAMAQNDFDDRFRELIKLTSEVYCLLNDLKLAALERHRQTIKLLTLQTAECAYFIRDYTKQKSFIIRAATHSISGAAMEGKISQYEKKFQELKVAFRDGAALHTEITVLRIAEQVDRIMTAGELDDLPYAPGARFDLGKQCLSGTREGLLDKIFDWVNNGDVATPRVLVLTAGAGSGKSAVAHTVSRRFNELQRLGSSFFFISDDRDRRPDTLFSTITRDMADLDPEWKEALKQVIGLRAVRKTSSVLEQFQEFILKPASRPPLYFGPVVIVIDALDASGDLSARQALLSLLSSRTKELPSNFRILLTTRPESDICDAFSKCKDVVMWDLEDELSSLNDITAFFTSELSGVTGWTDRICHKLTAKSEGDFGWGVAACGFIKALGASQTPAERMSDLLSRPKASLFNEADYSNTESETAFASFREKLHLPHFGTSWHDEPNGHGHASMMFSRILHPHQDFQPAFPVPTFYSNGHEATEREEKYAGVHGPY
ncbi:hypothetical protein DFH09DRAFT_1308502 [Mycena vulgaris]|nr:hypothetical protein DFH09DRAFT_1308502 [Mycena vulgaris]